MTSVNLKKQIAFIYEVGEDFWPNSVGAYLSTQGMKKYGISDTFGIDATFVDNRNFTEQHLQETDLVFLANLNMPPPDGFELLKRISRRRPDIPIVVSSASVPIVESSSQRPNILFLQKPFRLEKMYSILLEVLFVEPARKGQPDIELIEIQAISLDIIKHLTAHNEELYRVPGRFFEELVAELLHIKGWEVELTPIGADGGIDIIAIKGTDSPHKMLVQAKRFAEHRKVGVGIVREVLHILNDTRATTAMIATTSTFTKPAKLVQEAYKWRLSLADHTTIVQWLHEYSRDGMD